MRSQAYTLVEVLAVTVLLGLVAGLGAPPLLRTLAGDPLGRAAGHLAQTFRDARAQAYGRPLSLTLESWGFSAVCREAGGPTSLATTPLPEAIQVSWTRQRRPLRHLELDRRGHGLDTEVVLRQDDQEVAYTIDGLTGRWLAKAVP